MSGFLVATYDVLDQAALRAYRELAMPILCGPGRGRLLVATDRTQHLAAASCGGTHTVIVEFTSLGRAKEVYHSPEYREVLPLRLGATRPRAELIVGSMPDRPGSSR